MIEWRVQRTKAPVADVVTVDEVKEQSRIDNNAEDALVNRLIKAAVESIEGDYGMGLALAEQEWELKLDRFPHIIEVPIYPVKAIDAIEYMDQDGATETLDPSRYRVDLVSNPARITREYNEVWPLTRRVTNAVTIKFTAGFQSIPEDLRHAIILMVAHWYEHREPVVVGTTAAEVPMSAQSLLNRYRVVA